MTLPHYNVAPSQAVLSVIHDGKTFRTGTLTWGIRFNQGPTTIINIRNETLHEKPYFRGLLQKRRCLILANGFYEWSPTKQPFWITSTTSEWIAFAGLYTPISLPTQAKHFSTAIITTAANDTMTPIHSRMPVILNPDQYRHWLNPLTPIDEFNFLFKNTNHPNLVLKAISPYVNQPSHNDIKCLE